MPAPPTFKKPLKPQLLLFDLFVQSEPAQSSWALAHAWLGLAAMLPPGIARTSKRSTPMSGNRCRNGRFEGT
jgi:hypothetical protein